MKKQSILETIGNTPIVRINKLFSADYEVWIKLERFNPSGSIKDRIAMAMIEEAEKRGILKKGSVIIEPTSGNTGVGLAMVAAIKGYKLIIVLPESFSLERKKLISVYGAELVLTPKEKGMNGAIEKAEELQNEIPNSWIPQQFENQVNTEIHRNSTAQEIINDFKNEKLDYLISGVGTGGHISGVGEVLKKTYPNLKVFAVEPEVARFISKKQFGAHAIQGIAPNFVPKNLNKSILDGTISVSMEQAYDYTRKIASVEGILLGISSGASLAAISKKLPEFSKGSRILTFGYDTGERYFSVEGLF